MVVKSPGLKRVGDDLDKSFEGNRKRIRFCEQDSTGADIEPQAKYEELVTEMKHSKQGEKFFNNFVTSLNNSEAKRHPYRQT